MEVWKDIKGYENRYIISNQGHVLSYKGKMIKLRLAINGYLRAWLYNKHSYKVFSVHRLVSENFIPNPEGKLWVNHIDGNKINNTTNNLEWCTQSENMLHTFKTGLQTPNFGERNGHAKISDFDVLLIREVHDGDCKTSERLAKTYNVTPRTIWRIINRKTFTHI